MGTRSHPTVDIWKDVLTQVKSCDQRIKCMSTPGARDKLWARKEGVGLQGSRQDGVQEAGGGIQFRF